MPGDNQTEVGLLPGDWEATTIGHVASFSGGSQPPRSTFKFAPVSGYVRLVQIRDYKTDEFATYVPELLARKRCTAEDIMIGRYGPPVFQILRGIEGAYNVALIKTTPTPRIDREFYAMFESAVRENDSIVRAVEAGQWDRVIDFVNKEVFDKPTEYYSLERLRKAAGVDRRLSLREILEKIFGLIPRFKSKDELLEEEFSKFVSDLKPEEAEAIPAIKTYFKAYATSDAVRQSIESGHLTDLATNAYFSTRDFRAVPPKYRMLIPDYIKDYVSLNQFSA